MNPGGYNEALLMGNMIPKHYIITKGFGDTDIGSGNKYPWETGSFDTARVMAQIENFNIVKYTSILPPEATEIPIAQARTLYHHGAVMGTIMAQVNGYRGERISAGIGTVQVRRIYDGVHIGGYVAEYMGNGDEQEARESLHLSLLHVFSRRCNPNEYMIFDEKHCIQEHTVQNRFGTVIAAIGFLSNIYPIMGRV